MGDKSAIEWTDATWNPLAGCTPVSAGCRNCYAASMALRLEAMGQEKYAGTAKRVGDGRAVFTGKINLAGQDEIDRPLKWRKPRRIFVNSMSDLFHEDVPPGFVYEIFEVMREAHWHTFQVLTKRPERIMAVMRLYGIGGVSAMARPWPANVWIGTSVEDQAAADERIPHLLRVPARVRFLSCEPLLGPVNLGHYLIDDWTRIGDDVHYHEHPALHWIIVGGESGPNARPMHPEWARSLRDQADEAGVAFFFKQHGEWISEAARPNDAPPNTVEPEQARWLALDGSAVSIGEAEMRRGDVLVCRVGKKAAGRHLDGREWNEVPNA